MLSYCSKCRKKNWNPKFTRPKNRKIMLLSKCAVSDNKKEKLMKEQEASGLLSSLGIKAHLSKAPLVGPLLF